MLSFPSTRFGSNLVNAVIVHVYLNLRLGDHHVQVPAAKRVTGLATLAKALCYGDTRRSFAAAKQFQSLDHHRFHFLLHFRQQFVRCHGVDVSSERLFKPSTPSHSQFCIDVYHRDPRLYRLAEIFVVRSGPAVQS